MQTYRKTARRNSACCFFRRQGQRAEMEDQSKVFAFLHDQAPQQTETWKAGEQWLSVVERDWCVGRRTYLCFKDITCTSSTDHTHTLNFPCFFAAFDCGENATHSALTIENAMLKVTNSNNSPQDTIRVKIDDTNQNKIYPKDFIKGEQEPQLTDLKGNEVVEFEVGQEYLLPATWAVVRNLTATGSDDSSTGFHNLKSARPVVEDILDRLALAIAMLKNSLTTFAYARNWSREMVIEHLHQWSTNTELQKFKDYIITHAAHPSRKQGGSPMVQTALCRAWLKKWQLQKSFALYRKVRKAIAAVEQEE